MQTRHRIEFDSHEKLEEQLRIGDEAMKDGALQVAVSPAQCACSGPLSRYLPPVVTACRSYNTGMIALSSFEGLPTAPVTLEFTN